MTKKTSLTNLLDTSIKQNQVLMLMLVKDAPEAATNIIITQLNKGTVESLTLASTLLNVKLTHAQNLKSATTVKKQKPKTVKKVHPTVTKLQPTQALSVVINFTKPLTRLEAVKRIWQYIRKHNLQDKTNKRNINCDEKMKAVTGKDAVTMFELAAIVGKHLKA